MTVTTITIMMVSIIIMFIIIILYIAVHFHICLSLRFNRSTQCLATFAITGLTSDLLANSVRLFVLKVRQLSVRGSLTPT